MVSTIKWLQIYCTLSFSKDETSLYMAAHDDTYGYIWKYSDGLSSISWYKLLNILVPKSMTSANYG